MPAGDEHWVEQRVVDFARKKGMLPLKLQLQNDTGWPDRMFLFNGRVAFIEFKRPGESLRRNQPARVAALRSLGFNVGVINNVKDGIAFLQATLLPA